MIISVRTMLSFWGKAILLFSSIFWMSAAIAWYFEEPISLFVTMGMICLLLGGYLALITSDEVTGLHGVQCFVEIFLLWHIVGLIGAIPFYYQLSDVKFIMCFFEAISGLTTTGLEVFDINRMGRSLLFYHQALEFIGGIGVVVFLLAIFPERFHNAARLFNVEVTGPNESKQFLVRIGTSARFFSFLYVVLTTLCFTCLWLTGVDWFSAICESFGVISTGGFAIHDDGLLFYRNDSIIWVAIAFMLLGSISFRSHYLVWIARVWNYYFFDRETRVYLLMMASVLILVVGTYLFTPVEQKLLHWVYQVVAIMTTTGVKVDGVSLPDVWLFILTIMGVIGGCAGSTAGGIKWARILYLSRQFKRSILFFINRHQVLADDKPGKTARSLEGFGAIVIWSYLIFAALFIFSGLSIGQSLQLTIAALSCVGAMLIEVVDMTHLSSITQWLTAEAMIAGRMELIVFWVLFSFSYWRK